MYGGTGNDTIKGNNGDDTIYGGSGSDTINGNNGNDTIIGGFGADNLTSGNGSDRFVYLSVVDSHAGQFDTITDFASGSDKIDLTALGALAFLALTSTSTSVPAHTIAWLYDSAANETIVYVNPTDQTLSIGNSGLLEIHLQGIATILASDFVTDPAPAPVVVAGESIYLALAATAGSDGIAATTNTADVSPLSTVSDSAPVADGSRTLHTTDKDFSFDAGRDWFDLPGHDRFAFREGRSDASKTPTMMPSSRWQTDRRSNRIAFTLWERRRIASCSVRRRCRNLSSMAQHRGTAAAWGDLTVASSATVN
jgi:hypothetical protein